MEAEPLAAEIRRQMAGACGWPDEQRDALLQRIRQRFGAGVTAVLVYGSYRRGRRDTLIDFYVLVDGYRDFASRWQAWLCRLLPPNVYQVRANTPGGEARAKCAVLPLARFERAMKRDFHPYFWARFVQPCGLLLCSGPTVRSRLETAIEQAWRTFVQRVVPCLPDGFDADCLVATGFRMTYACELRSELPGQEDALFAHDAAFYRNVVDHLAGQGLGFEPAGEAGTYRNTSGGIGKFCGAAAWSVRRVLGKPLSFLRVLKAGLTFDEGFEYLVWKIARHSGVEVELTVRQRKHPLLFGWPVVWRLYRRGAFR